MTDSFIVEIPGMQIFRIRDGRVEVFADLKGVSYANMGLEHVVALEKLYAKVVSEMQALGEAALAEAKAKFKPE